MGNLISCPKHPQFMLAESFSSDEEGQNSVDEFMTKSNGHIRPNIAQMWVAKGLDHAFEWVDPDELKVYTKERKQSLKQKKIKDEQDALARARAVAKTVTPETDVGPTPIPVFTERPLGWGTKDKKRGKSPAGAGRTTTTPLHKVIQGTDPGSRFRPRTPQTAPPALGHKKTRPKSKIRPRSKSPQRRRRVPRSPGSTSPDTVPWKLSHK